MDQNDLSEISQQLQKRRFSLRVSLSFIISSVVILTSIILGLYSVLVGTVGESMRLRLHDSLGLAAVSIDVNKLEKLYQTRSEASSEYKSLVNDLIILKDRLTSVKYVYTFKLNDSGKLEYFLDAEQNEKYKSHIGKLIKDEDVTGAMRMVLAHSQINPVVESGITSDEYGNWLSGYIPIKNNSGKTIGALGMDIDANVLMQGQKQFVYKILIISILIILLVLPICLYIAKKISNPLAQIAQEMSQIGRLELQKIDKPVSLIKEINQISFALDQMKSALRSFKKYVPADLVVKLIQNGVDASVGFDNRKEISILFADLKGFTSLSDKIDVEKLSQIMNGYLSAMADVCSKYGGTLDKFIGDGILIYFGDLESKGKSLDALNCCKMAISMQRQMDSLNEKWMQLNLIDEPLKLRIGINSDVAAVGNFGSTNRINYTAIGSAVNMASRLESNAPAGGILISSSTNELICQQINTTYHDLVGLKGFSNKVKTYIINF